MSEVPTGLEIPPFERKPPRQSATLMATRDSDEGVEVLLCRRVDSMPSFPGYWVFPGGGISRVDKEASSVLGISTHECAVLREMVEELGLAPSEGKLISVDDNFRSMVAEDKGNWFPLALDGDIPCDNTGIRIISRRTTPPFAPFRFENVFFHIHASNHDDFSLIGQTEFDNARWARPQTLIEEWKNNDIKIAPPVLTLLMEIDRCLKLMDGSMEKVSIDLEKRKPGRRSILFAHGVEVVPIPTATLPPADHTNCYIVGDTKTQFVLVDPAFRNREGMEKVAEAIERHQGELIAIVYTHSHSDHVADIGLLREAFDAPIWSGSESSDRKLTDGEVLQLGEQTWTILHTPGHHPEHICLLSDSGLIAGDMVAGFGTILIPPNEGDMNEYLNQLERIRDLNPHLLFPSHGPVIPLPQKKLNHYISHRMKRHNLILNAIEDGLSSLEEIARFAYADTPDAHPGLAIDQTLSHLIAHEKEENIRRHENGWVLT
ncbi:MAG: MBL fold metallo-hydrolase [Candidatus Poseidoniaceae archaeon]|nr:MBL fold metallo-hydrolase [Candidatus Poseidoniaceae archaeon]